MYGTTNTPVLLKVPFGLPAKHSPQNIVFFFCGFVYLSYTSGPPYPRFQLSAVYRGPKKKFGKLKK